MKQIVLQVEITGLEGWDVNWEDEAASRHHIEELKRDLKNAIAEDLGIYLQDIEVSTIDRP